MFLGKPSLLSKKAPESGIWIGKDHDCKEKQQVNRECLLKTDITLFYQMMSQMRRIYNCSTRSHMSYTSKFFREPKRGTLLKHYKRREFFTYLSDKCIGLIHIRLRKDRVRNNFPETAPVGLSNPTGYAVWFCRSIPTSNREVIS